MASVFLSYDHEDSSLARPIAVALEKAGHSVWFDRHIHGGAQYSRKIEEALDEADAVVVLWSPRSLESAWVRDEAAEGRDRGKLVPLRIGGVSPPMGFRQFQTINLGEWKGRGKVPRFAELLEAVTSQVQERGAAVPGMAAPAIVAPDPVGTGSRRSWIVAGVAVLLIAAIGFGAWKWLGRGKLPVVEVTAANASPRSQASANDLFVKLGSLAQVGKGKWQLVDVASAPSRSDLVFRTADTSSGGQPQANLVLLDGRDDSLLWSREFSFPAGGEADLRQLLSLTAGRVLGCALESREAGGLRRDLLKLFLNACASMTEDSFEEASKVAGPLRTIVTEAPKFKPAWGRLILTDLNLIDAAAFGGDVPEAVRQLSRDITNARKIAPGLPEIAIAEAGRLPSTEYEKQLSLLSEAADRTPDNARILVDLGGALQRVGRMYDAVEAARRAARLDPLSPAPTTGLIMTLAYSGQVDEARAELARAERLWAGTGVLREAEWAFHFRFGDAAAAKRYANFTNPGLDAYLAARTDPSTTNVAKLLERIRQYESTEPGKQYDGSLLYTLAEFNQTDHAFAVIARASVDAVARDSYILFRPGVASVRRDPRFMAVAKRIGLIDYWRKSGKWPDFCDESGFPYDCKTEAAKYG